MLRVRIFPKMGMVNYAHALLMIESDPKQMERHLNQSLKYSTEPIVVVWFLETFKNVIKAKQTHLSMISLLLYANMENGK